MDQFCRALKAWLLLVVPTGTSLGEITEEIADECASQLPDPVVRMVCVGDDVNGFVATCASADGEVVIADAAAVTSQTWGRIDVARSALLKLGVGVLVLTERDLSGFIRGAPNFASLVGAETFRWSPDPSTLDRDAREAMLVSFRERSGMTDDQLVVAVGEGTAPLEPYVAQWLVLLGREDLLRG